MKLSLESLKNAAAWEKAGVVLPNYSAESVSEAAKREPIWIHFGAGNIFRGFIASLQHRLIGKGLSDKGIIAAEAFDFDIIDKIYAPCDNLVLNTALGTDGRMEYAVYASIAEAIKVETNGAGFTRLAEVFASPSLQLASFTITEKGYALRGADGELINLAKEDIKNGPDKPSHIMSVAAAMLYKRFKAGRHPIAMLSMDNCSKNGGILRDAVHEIARGWHANGFVCEGFMEYINTESIVSFPWSMVDKITPRPSGIVLRSLERMGIEGMEPVTTSKGTSVAAFVNAEVAQYLVVEDNFPNGRPPFEHAGVYMTDRETVNKSERMKVTACLNPIHTSMALFGCLLGYKRISSEMEDKDITALIRRLGYVEGLRVVVDPGIISPLAFLNEVLNERLPNPFVPDEPQRIAADTSLKVSIRFGETIKSYIKENRSLSELIAIPLSIAAWMRYLLAVNDKGEPMELAPDPQKEALQTLLNGVIWDDPESYKGQLIPILSNANIFGIDLAQTELAERIERYFVSMLEGAGAVRKTLVGGMSNQR